MSKIKYINCFGTSFTAGGGFEFDGNSIGRNNFLKSYYSNLDEELTQYNFSYPGQLQKLLKNIKVFNHAKNGYGNDRMYRLAYDIISSSNFNSEEHIFLLEFGGLGRKEYWYNEINDFIVLNYWVDWDNYSIKDKVNIAQSYCYDSPAIFNQLKDEESFFLEFHKKTFDFKNEIKYYEQQINFFISYLDSKNVNYFLVNENHTIDNDKHFTFGDGNIFKQSKDFTKFTNINGLELDIETNYLYDDKHNGYVATKIISQSIYNHLIDVKLLDLEKINIDYEGLLNLKLPKIDII